VEEGSLIVLSYPFSTVFSKCFFFLSFNCVLKRTETLEGLIESLEGDKGNLTRQIGEQEALLRKIKAGFQRNEREQTSKANDEQGYALHMELRIKELEANASRHQEADKKLRLELQVLKDRNGLCHELIT